MSKRPVVKHQNTHKGIPTYGTWRTMLERCYYTWSAGWHSHGAKGIKVCRRWWSYENFIADMGERPEGMTLDRINGHKGYNPNNCRWATDSVQSSNTRNNRKSKYVGVYYRETHKIPWYGEMTVRGKRYIVKAMSENEAHQKLTRIKESLRFNDPTIWRTKAPISKG